MLSKDRRARVPRALRFVIKAVIALRIKGLVCQLHFLRFDFLNADNISPLLRKPTEEPFSFRRSDAIGIARDHSKHRASAPAHSTCVSGVVKQTSLAMTTERTSAGGFSRVFQTVLLPSVTGTISRPLSVIDPHKRPPIITSGRVAMISDYPA
jgi:hypothetical protein